MVDPIRFVLESDRLLNIAPQSPFTTTTDDRRLDLN